MLASLLLANWTSKVHRPSRNSTLLRKWLHCADNSTCNRTSPHCVCGSPGGHFYDHFTPSPMGVTISNNELICISVIAGGNMSKCSLGMSPFGSLSPEHYRPKRVLGGISVPSKLLSRSSPLWVHSRSTPCGPAPSLSYLLPLGGWFLREVSQLTSLSSICWVGLPWSRMWQQVYRHCHPGGAMIWATKWLPCSSC